MRRIAKLQILWFAGNFDKRNVGNVYLEMFI